MASSRFTTAIVFLCLFGLWMNIIGACALDVEQSNTSPISAALESDGSTILANTTEFEEKDYEEIAKSEGRKDWTLAIEEARKVLAELQPDSEFRAAELDDETSEKDMHEYKIVFRSASKSCVVKVKQEAEDKFSVYVSDEDEEKAICTEEDE